MGAKSGRRAGKQANSSAQTSIHILNNDGVTLYSMAPATGAAGATPSAKLEAKIRVQK